MPPTRAWRSAGSRSPSRWSLSSLPSWTKAESARGQAVSLERVGEYISVRVPGIEGALELPPEVAAHVFVSVS